MVEFGMPMGPLTLIDMAGVDVLLATDRVMIQAFPHHGLVADVAVRLVHRGHYGQKASAGVYSYQPGDYTPHPSAVSEELVDLVRREKGISPRAIGQGEITERLSLRMVVEAFAALQEEIARQESDLDVATVLGIGFPDFRGGVIKYARDRGLSRVLHAAEDLAGRHGERFTPCELLRTLAKKGAG
jgi:3-hydroxyacyl-CoA dehydrogenase